jgi:DNA-binding NarL/FixJ family response regulator
MAARGDSRGDDVRILIVDDQPVARKAIRELLEKRGHDVVAEAPGAEAALAAAAHAQPDVVIVDVRVGTESGFDIAQRLTQSQPGLAVLLTSVNPGTTPEMAQAAGARAFVLKQRLHTVDLFALSGGETVAARPEA